MSAPQKLATSPLGDKWLVSEPTILLRNPNLQEDSVRKLLGAALLLGIFHGPAWAKPEKVSFRPQQLRCVNDPGPNTAVDCEELRRSIVASWQAYEDLDATGFLGWLDPQVIRATKRAGKIAVGREQVGLSLKAEWSAFEKQGDSLAENLKVSSARVRFDSPKQARVEYWVETSGGGRWDFSDQGLVLQFWTKGRDGWKLAYHTDSWGLSYDCVAQRPGKETLDFDFVYPVNQLKRAVEFYRPLLGEPVLRGSSATFNLGGPRFILASNPLGPYCSVRLNKPSGYAVYYVDNLANWVQRHANLRYLQNSNQHPMVNAEGDSSALFLDPSDNILVVSQHRYADNCPEKPSVAGLEGTSLRLTQAWLDGSFKGLRPLLAHEVRWFDDSQTRTLGPVQGIEQLERRLGEFDWSHYDRGSSGLALQLRADSQRQLAWGSGCIVCYQANWQGQGPHSFSRRSFVTDVFDRQGKLLQHFVTDANPQGPVALELDYTGYPVTDLQQAGKFYSHQFGLGKPYSDSDYLGWWSNVAVFGIYRADPKLDGLPTKRQTNGYVSFWVRSAQAVYTYAQARGRNFPTIPAINSKAGISSEPGYHQLVTTDTEGNLVLFTEYTGKRH